MLSELHLKFHSETGTCPTPKELFDEDENPVMVASDDYIDWLEEVATKYFHQNLSGFKKEHLENELHRRELRELSRLVAIERSKNNGMAS